MLKFESVGNSKDLKITAFENLKHSKCKNDKNQSAQNSKQFNSELL